MNHRKAIAKPLTLKPIGILRQTVPAYTFRPGHQKILRVINWWATLKNLENQTIQQLQKSGFCINFLKFNPISRSLIICKYNHKATQEISSKDRKYSPRERKNYRSLPLTSIKRIVIPDITLSILQSQKNKETKYRNCDRYIF